MPIYTFPRRDRQPLASRPHGELPIRIAAVVQMPLTCGHSDTKMRPAARDVVRSKVGKPVATQ